MNWIAITLVAAFLQNVRSSLQKALSSRLSTAGATSARFIYGAPFALIWLAGVRIATGESFPVPGAESLVFLAIGAVSQIVATFLLIASFRHAPFAVGTALSKTESLQAAAFSGLVLSEHVSALGWAGLVLGLAGVFLLVHGPKGSVTLRGALVAVLSGSAFAVSAVAYRGASLALGDASVVLRASMILVAAISLQTGLMAFWLIWREPGEMSRVLKAWRSTVPTALAGVAASAGWFMAMTLQQVAYVRALAQIELAFSTLTGVFFFGETLTARDLAGVILIGLSVVLVLFAAAG